MTPSSVIFKVAFAVLSNLAVPSSANNLAYLSPNSSPKTLSDDSALPGTLSLNDVVAVPSAK